MSTSDIQREFDPNLDVPEDLKNVVIVSPDETNTEEVVEIDEEFDDSDLDDAELPEDDPNDALDPPGFMEIIGMVVRTGSDGTQVVDVTVEVEDIEQAVDYQVRITKP